MSSGLPEDLWPWTRVTEEKGKPGATWAVGLLRPKRCVLASGSAASANAAREALKRACARLCEAMAVEAAA
jgi:ribosomal protein L16/L10AE